MIKPFLLLIICMVVSLCVSAQLSYLNTKTPYHPQQLHYTPVPQGYTAVFVNYTGRHGARFQTSAQKDRLVEDVLKQANEEHALTAEGNVVYEDVRLLEDIEKDKYGNITRLGEREQHDIAERMQANNATVFSNGKLLVEMTDKARTQQSAASFLSGLRGYDSASAQRVIFPSSSDSILRFYDLSEAYKNYLSGKEIKRHTDTLMNDKRTANAANDVCKHLFAKSFADKLDSAAISSIVKDKKQVITAASFSLALYDVYASLFSTTEELGKQNKDVKSEIGKAFSRQSLLWFDEITSASDFYEKGPADDDDGVQVIIAAPLVRDMINTTDSAIQYKQYNAVLRFTHAEAISPLAAFMGIPEASKESASVFTFSSQWKASEVIPMSANVQWILYSNGKDFLVKILLNEKEVAMPVATQSFPYYKWSDVRSFYLNKLSLLNKN